MLKSQMKKLLVATLALAFVACLGTVALAEQAMLSVDDCAKCHNEQPAQIAASGASHQTEIDCQACHEGHRPSVENNIPNCNDCHEGSGHYEVENCLGCHNPHQPLNVNLDGEHKKVCVSCHAGPNKEMVASPSMHATFACNFCHADTHGNIPECIDCHEPHSESMTQANCATCHQAHQPLELTYPATADHSFVPHVMIRSLRLFLPARPNTARSLAQPVTRPSIKLCLSVTNATVMPHAASMHERFPKCGECHNVAHDLNNWPASRWRSNACSSSCIC